MKISNIGWTKWLNDHATYDTYNAHPARVQKICTKESVAMTNFEELTKCKNIILLTTAPMGAKCQATFYHSIVGIPIIPDSLHHVARVGFKTGTGVELDPETLFTSTALKATPDLVSLMKISSKAEFENLKADGRATKRNFQSYAVLTPSLAKAVQETDMSYSAIFRAVVEQIKIGATPVPPSTPPAQVDPAPAPETEDELLLRLALPFESVLYFLWGCHHLEKDIKVPVMMNLQDDDTLQWEKSTRDLELGTKKSPVTFDLAGSNQSSDLSAGAISAMTKLSASMIKHQEATLKSQEEKGDNRMKAWRRLPKIQQNVIVLAGVEDDGTVPTEPTEEMLSILGCQNGAQVEQFLRQSMQGHNMCLEPGFCTALNKGMFVCPDDVDTPKNFTAFLTPPVNDDEDAEENANLLKLAVQEKYDSSDLILLTKMDITIPMKTQELRHHVKNYAGVAGRTFGKDSVAHTSLKKIVSHISKYETSYNYEFRQEKLFGGNFLDRINWRYHRFLDSCASGDVENIDLKKLDFNDMLEQVERREYHTKVPSWIRKMMKKKEKKHGDHDRHQRGSGGGGGGGRGSERTRRQFGSDSDRSKKIANANSHEGCMLKMTEQFRDLFHPGNIRNLEKPKIADGTPMCLRFHTLGSCFTDCKYKDGHTCLTTEEARKMKSFVDSARANRASYMDRRNSNGDTTNSSEHGTRNRNPRQGQQRQPPGQANTNTSPPGESQQGTP